MARSSRNVDIHADAETRGGANCAESRSRRAAHAPDALHQLNESIETLVQRISPSVVQIQVTGYGATQESSQGQTSVVIGKQRAIGSGVIVDPDGYIVTNAHVVTGAEKIEVIVPPQLAADASADRESRDAREKLRGADRRSFERN